jgi:predicted short-subunit dehydrogenase-like oxidoreductase (DUF2520 family)
LRAAGPARRSCVPLRTAAVLGGGAVGRVLLPALRAAGLRVLAAWSRSPHGSGFRTGPLPRSIALADVVLMPVADQALGPLCARLTREGLLRPGQLVVHLAGALDLLPLAPALAAGASTGSLHPLCAIAPGSGPAALAGAACGIDGSDRIARARLFALARALGLRPIGVVGQRPLYHAACVLAAGAQVALFAEALGVFRAATRASEAAARDALLPLSLGALAALRRRRPPEALTGPVARGDAVTVRAHLSALAARAPAAAELYRWLGCAALALLESSERLQPRSRAVLRKALAERAMLPPPTARSSGGRTTR